jgi:hypothetical protein
VETPSDDTGMGAVRSLCEYSLLVSRQNHSDLSLAVQDDALKRYNNMICCFRDQQMSKSVNC